MNKFELNINAYNHVTVVGNVCQHPLFKKLPRGDKYLFKVSVIVPRNHKRTDSNGKLRRVMDEVHASCWINSRQFKYYRNVFIPGTWVVLRGEVHSMKYRNPNGRSYISNAFSLKQITPYHKPDDPSKLTPDTKELMSKGAEGLKWLIAHPNLVRKNNKKLYDWLIKHDAFVPTKLGKNK